MLVRDFKTRLAAEVLLTGAVVLIAVHGLAVSTNTAYLTRVWEWEDGLPDNSIVGVAQASDGLLWVATAGGLARFDGVHFEEFFPSNIPGGANHIVRGQFIDRRGRLWLNLARGILACVELDALRVFTPADGLLNQLIVGFAEDAQGTLWLAYINGDLMRIQDGKVRQTSAEEGLLPGVPYRIASGPQGELWFARGTEVGVFRNGRALKLATLNETVVQICPARAGGIWIHSASKLLRFQEGRSPEEKTSLPPCRNNEPVRPLLEDSKGAVWIGTAANGLLYYGAQGLSKTTTSHEEITCLAEDREGNLWVGTGGGGLDRLRPRFITRLTVAAGEASAAIRSVTEDLAAKLWAVTADGKVMREEGSSWVTVSEGPEWSGVEATCAVADTNGAVWIGTATTGLYQHRQDKLRTHRESNGLFSDSVRTLFVSSVGELWIGFSGRPAVQRMHASAFQSFHFPESAREIRAFAEDAAGRIWVATAAGHLYRVEADKLVRETAIDESREQSIRCLHATEDGSLWIGYAGWGIGRLKTGAFSRIANAQGLGEDYISGIAADPQGRLWCTGRRGLFHVPLQELLDLAEGKTTRVNAGQVYSRNEGVVNLLAPVYSVTGPLRRRDGRLCFPMGGGLAVLQPENFPLNPAAPPVLLGRVVVDDMTTALYDSQLPLRKQSQARPMNLRLAVGTLRLPPGHRKVEFEFTASSFSAPENVHFRYRLEGFDLGWQEAESGRKASYPRLPAGNYRFLVAARNDAGAWGESTPALNLSVPPFVWQTWWFRALVLTAFTLSVVAVVRYVSLRRLREQMRQVQQQAALDGERARIARDMHDTVGASLTQIGLLGELAHRPATSPDQTRDYVRKMTEGSHALVQQLDEIVWAVDPENDTLEDLAAYVSQFVEEFFADSPIRCRMKAPAMLPALRLTTDVRHNLFLAVREALNNVARHSQATEASVNLTVEHDAVVLRIEDNGRGFKVGMATDRHGLENLKRRLSEIGGACRIESSEGTGTKIVLTWPCRNQPMS
jgi:signal transduction histidine kinase/ligand-binding sensor domain-containing protein